ncbi:MAG: glutathione-dependent disulfide-bond oxidoreductase, partial [Endozoicomonas sp. (ex Botrylloides leachii)]|nr:glutathione-dependent disulfide-bond oxidoreductase [Endozoicomonas sp. (ex Botrylloides leachii)]
ALGYSDAEYDAHLIRISNGEQFGSDFVGINPNSKIPAMLDCSVTPPIRVFESGSILLYLAEKFDIFLPKDARSRTECLNWLFWQVGSAPYVGGGFGHFYKYAPLKIEYCIDRFTMETKRQLDVLNQHLEKSTYMVGETYTIADIAIWPWYGSIVLNDTYEAAEFLNAEEYTHLCRWAKHIEKRIPVKRGRIANKTFGPVEKQLHERHNATDLDKIFDSA